MVLVARVSKKIFCKLIGVHRLKVQQLIVPDFHSSTHLIISLPANRKAFDNILLGVKKHFEL